MGSIKPNSRLLTIWRIQLSIAICIPAFLNSVLFKIQSPIWLWGTALWIIAFVVVYLVYLPMKFKSISYSVKEDRILLYTGVIYPRIRIAPKDRIQFSVVLTSPFERIFGLASLQVVLAGGRVVLPGLRHSDADILSQSILLDD